MRVLSFESFWVEAASLAAQWNSQAELVSFRALLVTSMSRESTEKVYYRFEASDISDRHFYVICSPIGCEGKEYSSPNNYLALGIPPIDPREVVLETEKIAQIAIQNGGDEYIYEAESFSSLALGYDFNGLLCWQAFFSLQGKNPLTFCVNPSSGEILE